MQLSAPFFKLPLSFDLERLRQEAASLSESFCPHPQGFQGSDSVPLVTPGGRTGDDGLIGPMGPTQALLGCPYLLQIMESLQTTIGRARIMRLADKSEVPLHRDTSYYWLRRMRLHIPIVTDPNIIFSCADEKVHMAAGECWTLNNATLHGVSNPSNVVRQHLVIDTVGSDVIWNLLKDGRNQADLKPSFLKFRPGHKPQLSFEQVNSSRVMPPAEIECLMRLIIDELYEVKENQEETLTSLIEALEVFRRRWTNEWAAVGDSVTARYDKLRQELLVPLKPLSGKLQLEGGHDAVQYIRSLLLESAVNPQLKSTSPPAVENQAGKRRAQPQAASPQAAQPTNQRQPAESPSSRLFDRPTFIVCPPRSGSTLLFETLAGSPALYTIGKESHQLFEGISALHPAQQGWESNRIGADLALEPVVAALESRLSRELRDRNGARPEKDLGLRLLEKTPKNALRIPFLKAAFPDARFIFLYRPPRETMSSMLEAWRTEKFITYPQLPGWTGEKPWSLLLTERWQEMKDWPLARVVAAQWTATMRQLIDDLLKLPPTDWAVADYHSLISQPQQEVSRLCQFMGVPWDRKLKAPLPLAQHMVSPPDPSKWKKNWVEIEPEAELAMEQVERAHALFARQLDAEVALRPPQAHLDAEKKRREAEQQQAQEALRAKQVQAPSVILGKKEQGHGLRSVHTNTLPEILHQVAGTLAISTYQSGRVILASERNAKVNTHFVALPKPMGIAFDGKALAIGGRASIYEYRNQPALCRQLPEKHHDACFVPRASKVTGDLLIHEMAWGKTGLWAVNTRFSCLCTFDADHSFIPAWRPSFIKELVPEDRCHLNGLAMLNGEPRVVSALGTTGSVKAGWRPKKTSDGCLIDIESGEFITRGLCMPHSPRFYRDQLWVLESGTGELQIVDQQSGERRKVAQVPGFARGLVFYKNLAFIGLSQVREKIFDGIPLGERLTEKACGVWVVDIDQGTTIGFLRFDGDVQEVFDVQLLHGLKDPAMLDLNDPLQIESFVVPPQS